MNVVYIISGVSKGLGYALANSILLEDLSQSIVIGLSRSPCNLTERFPENFVWIKTDFSKTEETLILLDNTLSKYNSNKICFISNAGEINPISKVGKHIFLDLHNSVCINILSPVLIINYLISNYSIIERLILVNITSGAANKAIQGWSLYSSAKSYMKMYFNVLATELDENTQSNILLKQIDPGAMDTDMQKVIRQTSISSEQADKLKSLFENGQLRLTSNVAIDILKQINVLL